jgi:nicotinate-nucleotide pyrophosphorylase (carboxylating)
LNRKTAETNLFSIPSNSFFNLHRFIAHALQEDVGSGDITSLSCIPPAKNGRAKLLVKDSGIIAGVELAQKIFRFVDHSLKFRLILPDGSPVQYGSTVFTVEGGVRSILNAERLVLNCMQRMSGIATAAHRLTNICRGTRAKITDTRKTTPGIRFLEKWAVKIGGGHNHRFGLYDMILIKDNHIRYAGSIRSAILAAQKFLSEKKQNLKIEIEAGNISQVQQILSVGGIHRIMLDNFSLTDLKKAVRMINRKYETEASGKVNEKTVRKIALTGVDYISVGALTHSVKALDMSLEATP